MASIYDLLVGISENNRNLMRKALRRAGAERRAAERGTVPQSSTTDTCSATPSDAKEQVAGSGTGEGNSGGTDNSRTKRKPCLTGPGMR